MATVISPPAGTYLLVPAHIPSRTGILLNASPASSVPNSPKNNPYLLAPVSQSNHPSSLVLQSASSAASTASSEDVASSSDGNTNSVAASIRRIRFAPLPEPRRDEDEQSLADNVDSLGATSTTIPGDSTSSINLSRSPANSRPTTPASASGSPAPFGFGNSPYSPDTLGLSFDGSIPSSGLNTETNTVIGADDRDRSSLRQLGGDSSNRPKRSRWLPSVLLGKVSTSHSHSSPEDNALCRASSRESVASTSSWRSGTLSDIGMGSFGNLLSRRMSGGSTLSEQPRGSKKPTPTKRPTGKSARGTRLLNGRVYGQKRNQNQNANPFASARDDEPEFVEWGYGGMGSVKNVKSSGAQSEYAKLASGNRVSIGHATHSVDDDEDDGSGLVWLKKRKEERARRAAAEAEAKKMAEDGKGKEKVDDGADGVSELPETHVEGAVRKAGDVEKVVTGKGAEVCSSVVDVPGPVAPADASEMKEQSRASTDKTSVTPKATATVPQHPASAPKAESKVEPEQAKEKERLRVDPEHITTAVSIPAISSKLHHTNSHSSAHSRSNSLHAHPNLVHLHHAGGAGVSSSPSGSTKLTLKGEGELGGRNTPVARMPSGQAASTEDSSSDDDDDDDESGEKDDDDETQESEVEDEQDVR